MKINFTKKEYRSLIDLLDIANWVINAHRTGIGEEPKEYADLIQKIYSFSKEMGCEDIIEFNKSNRIFVKLVLSPNCSHKNKPLFW